MSIAKTELVITASLRDRHHQQSLRHQEEEQIEIAPLQRPGYVRHCRPTAGDLPPAVSPHELSIPGNHYYGDKP